VSQVLFCIRDLVLYRLVYPKSKLKTTEYLYRFSGKDYSEDDIYRYMDRLHNTQKEIVQKISYEHSKKVLGEDFQVVFYDVTTLHFEIDREDDFRKTGFSKAGKHQNPQIVLGLLVDKQGYPLAYEIFEGNKFEGHTMLPVLNTFKKRYDLKQLIVVADSGLLSKDNIEKLISNNYEFILGARIKNEPQNIKDKILSLKLNNGGSRVIKKGDLRLIVTFSDDRAKKDKYNREKGLRKLEKRVKSGKLTKANINNRGYNKYLTLKGEVQVSIDYKKYQKDARWDGLKGYITNAKLSKSKIISNYKHLWKIEKAFRITKTDLKIRPIYHRLQYRVEAHICLTFVSDCTDQLDQFNAEDVMAILQRLPDLLRVVFNMYELDGYSHKEIASNLRITESTSRAYLTRAKAKLRELFTKSLPYEY
jgi:RNA polymerase sigma factor (sigma-70 family)